MVFASILILLRSLKFKIYLIYCQLSRYHFCKIMFTIVSQCHRSVPFDPCTTSSFRPQTSALIPQTSTFKLPTSNFQHHPSPLSLPASSNFLQRETKILTSSSQSACIESYSFSSRYLFLCNSSIQYKASRASLSAI